MGYDGQFGDFLRAQVAKQDPPLYEAPVAPGVEFMVSMEEAAIIEEELGYKPTWMRRYVDDLILPGDTDV